jgi:hypothetical protein
MKKILHIAISLYLLKEYCKHHEKLYDFYNYYKINKSENMKDSVLNYVIEKLKNY